jgi:4-hydroxy-tetrahydrodipicolinate synthase
VLGTTGEAASIPLEERRAPVETTIEASAGRVTTYAGISANCFRESVEAARAYGQMGIDAVAAHPPFYYPLSDQQIEAWYQELADAVPVPLLLYNIPQTTHLSIPLDAVERLSGHANIVGIKDSENDAQRLDELLRRVGDRDGFSVLLGAGALYGRGLRGGAQGLVPSMGNLDPVPCRAMYDAAQAGNWTEMERAHQAVLALSAQYQQGRLLGESLSVLKAMMAERGLCGPTMLPPLRTHNHLESC